MRVPFEYDENDRKQNGNVQGELLNDGEKVGYRWLQKRCSCEMPRRGIQSN